MAEVPHRLAWLICLQMNKPEAWCISGTPGGIICLVFRVLYPLNRTDCQALQQTSGSKGTADISGSCFDLARYKVSESSIL